MTIARHEEDAHSTSGQSRAEQDPSIEAGRYPREEREYSNSHPSLASQHDSTELSHSSKKRRNRVAEAQQREGRNEWIRSLLIEGNTQAQIVRITGMSKATVSRALKSMKNQARESQRHYIENEIPLRHNIILDRVSALIQECYKLKEQSKQPEKEIALIAELTSLELSLLADPVAIEQALRKITTLKKKLGK